MKIKAAVVYEKGGPFQIKEVELDPPKRDEVLVKVTACGVCHTDEGVRQQQLPTPLPAVLGHEGCGIVEALGPGVTGFKKGDRVGFSYGYCGVCEACRTGQPYGCERNVELNFSGARYDGTTRLHDEGGDLASFFGQSAFATHAVVHVHNLILVPEDVELALVGPLGCGLQTGSGAVLNCLRPEPATSIVVTGCGSVGLSAVMAAKIAGCATIIACDVVDSRLEMAAELGATHTVNSRKVPDVVGEVKKITRTGAHYAVDCTGIGACVRQSLNCTRSLGTCAVVGATADMTINVEEELMGVCRKLVGVVEGYSVPQVYIPKLMEYYRKGLFPFDKFVKYYDFEDINQAFEDAHRGGVIKAILKMDN
jgi:aryl-alcohol dehydrogenase